MSVNTSDEYEESPPLPRSFDEVESARKKMRTDNSGRKSWSLMDRKTDHEVLQEMGVSLLEPDDSESLCDSGASGMPAKQLKRKHMDIENMNPNVNLVTSPRCITSPRSKYSPKSPRVKPGSPNAGPSKFKSPRSSEKHKPLQPTDQHINETSLLLDEYLIDEETPLAQSVSAGYLPTPNAQYSGATTDSSGGKHRYTPLGLEDELIISRRHKPEPVGAVSFNILSDEMILSVFRWLPKRTLAHCMMVCKRKPLMTGLQVNMTPGGTIKVSDIVELENTPRGSIRRKTELEESVQWHRVACDETLWQRLDLGNKSLSKDAIGRILARKPIIVRLASSEIAEWHPASLPAASRIHYLDLSMSTIDSLTLNNLLKTCPSLKKLSLESVQLQDSSCELIGKCSNLETLNLTMAQGVTAAGLQYILEGCNNLVSLNISWCSLSEAALDVLVTAAPQRLQRLNIGGARIMTDDIVERLVCRCPRLLELDVSDCGRLTGRAAVALTDLQRLEHLALSRCYLLPAHALTKLGSMPSLQYVDVWGMLHTHALTALRAALPHVQINTFMFSAIARPTVGTRRTSIWGLRTRD